MLFAVCWKRTTRNGALAGMVIGALTVLVWKHYGWLDLYEIIPGFLFASIAIVVFSLLGRALLLKRRRASLRRMRSTTPTNGFRLAALF